MCRSRPSTGNDTYILHGHACMSAYTGTWHTAIGAVAARRPVTAGVESARSEGVLCVGMWACVCMYACKYEHAHGISLCVHVQAQVPRLRKQLSHKCPASESSSATSAPPQKAAQPQLSHKCPASESSSATSAPPQKAAQPQVPRLRKQFSAHTCTSTNMLCVYLSLYLSVYFSVYLRTPACTYTYACRQTHVACGGTWVHTNTYTQTHTHTHTHEPTYRRTHTAPGGEIPFTQLFAKGPVEWKK